MIWETFEPDSSESSDDKYEDDDGTGAKDINCNGDRDGVGNRNTGSRGGSASWIRFLSPSPRTEALGAIEKVRVK